MARGSLTVGSARTVDVLPEPSLTGMGKLLQKTLHQDVPTRELFPTDDPEVDQINQQAIGDCWYLASIIAILYRPLGKMWVRRMMVDNLDGTVTVRLFDRHQVAHYLRVRKSLAMGAPSLVHAEAKYHSSGALWPAMLEKALTAFDHAGNYDLANAAYHRTQLNTSVLAFRMLLGHGVNGVFEDVIEDPKERTVADYGIQFDTKEGWDARTQPAWQRLVDQARKDKKVVRYEHFQAFMSEHMQHGNPTVSSQTRVFQRAGDRLAGKRFTGKYTALTHDYAYNAISAAAAAGKPVVAYTRDTVGRKQNLMGISANEPVSKGLAGNHAYAVLRAYQTDNIKYVELHNPWGPQGMGRDYVANKPVQVQTAVFSVELDDFIKRFSHLRLADALTHQRIEAQIRADRAP